MPRIKNLLCLGEKKLNTIPPTAPAKNALRLAVSIMAFAIRGSEINVAILFFIFGNKNNADPINTPLNNCNAPAFASLISGPPNSSNLPPL